jgi:hypothetical protein
MRDMPDVPIEAGADHGYPGDMEARRRVLEEIAASTKTMLAEIRADQRAMRAETTACFGAVRSEMAALDQRRERDFRLTFGALITTTLGLAYLIGHTAHWL